MSSEHSAHNSGIVPVALNLTAACLISGVIIGTVYCLTAPIAERSALELKDNARKHLVPDADKFEEVAGQKDWVAAYKDGTVKAYILPSESKGYGGSVKMLVAITPDARILNFTITESHETPGLGDKAAEPHFKDQFHGKDIEHLKVVKDPQDHADILAITGATITSRAVTKAIKDADEQLSVYLRRK